MLWDEGRQRWNHIVGTITPRGFNELPDGGHVGRVFEISRRGHKNGYLQIKQSSQTDPPCPAFDIMPYLMEEWFPGAIDNPPIEDPEPVETSFRPEKPEPIQVPQKVFQEHSERHYKAYLELGDIPNAEKIAAEYLMRCGVKIPGWRDPVDVRIEGLLSTLVVLESETMGSPEKARTRQMEIAVLLYQQGKLQAENLAQVEKGHFNRATLTQAWNGEVIETPAVEARPVTIPSTGGVRRTLSVEPTEDGAEVVLTTSAKIEGPEAAEHARDTAEELLEAAARDRLREYMARKQAEQEDREAAKDQALSGVPFTRPSTNGHHKAKGGAR